MPFEEYIDFPMNHFPVFSPTPSRKAPFHQSFFIFSKIHSKRQFVDNLFPVATFYFIIKKTRKTNHSEFLLQ